MFNSDPKVRNTSDKTDAIFLKIKPLVPKTSYSKLFLRECFEDEYGTTTIVVDGGLNGKGNWSGYLNDLSKLLAVLSNEFSDAYIIFIDNDCIDDVFVAHIAIKL